jgi:signal transduction histidine kinase/ActR/RegA family two-component response regulator
MSIQAEVSRLNRLLEFFADCATAATLEELLQTVTRQLHWLIEFDGWGLALVRGAVTHVWASTTCDPEPRRLGPEELEPGKWELLQRVVASGVPEIASHGSQTLGVPLESGRRAIGAFSLVREAGAYTAVDVRLMHHVGKYLGTLSERIRFENETRELNQRKDEVLALLGHELRNPLAPILTAVELLKRREPGGASRELIVIERQATHLLRLVHDLLDVARLTRGDIRLTRAPIEIASVVTLAIQMSAPLLEQQRHSLRTRVPQHGLCVEGDESRLAQVLSNLLNNSARYTDPGGHIAIRASREGDEAVVDIVDDGIGFSATSLPTLFDVFTRHPRRSAESGGLGLGLAVVKRLTELHGGSVSASSAGLGLGAKFSVRLPCLPAEYVLAPPVAMSPTALDAERSERVLLVDDNVDASDLFATILRSAGHNVVVAHDGPSALELFEGFCPSIAVLDLGMPVMDGFELARQIQRRLGMPQPRLIALTGYGQARDRARSRAAGFATHLVKPVSAQELLRAVLEPPSPAA